MSVVALVGCSRTPDDLREWKPSDHDHTQSPGQSQVAAAPDSGRPSGATGIPGLDELTLAAWRRNCTVCHGAIGRGDGPRGAETRATNLGDPAWQASVTDADIAAVIKGGRGAMPPFALPDETIAGLVRLVRMLAPRPADAGVAPPAADAAPAPSADVAPAPPASAAPAPPASAGPQ